MEGRQSLRGTEPHSPTGVQVSYYFICKTKLWLFSHLATMEHSSDTVAMGKLVHKESYQRAKKDVTLGAISIDFVKRGDEVVLHEVKKSRKMERAHVFQLLYYLYYLKRKDVKARGIVNYPLLRRTREIVLDEEKEREIEAIIREIDELVAEEKPPKPKKKTYCRKCSYYEFCWVS
jgi:CRISPR-associated exonuclease Cas4